MSLDKPTRESKLRWFQIRLRTLVLAFTTVTVVLAAFGFFVRPYLLQRDVIQAIKNAGGVVETRPGPSWLRAILGEENCQEITLVNLADIDPSKQMLSSIAGLPELEVLVLGGASLEDDDLRFVPKCESLEGVILDSTLISDEALANLRAARPEVYIARCDRRAIAYWQSDSQWGRPRFETRLESAVLDAPPRQLADRLPNAYFEQVTGLRAEKSADDKAFGFLTTMHKLRDLSIRGDSLTQGQLLIISNLEQLECLEIYRDPRNSGPTDFWVLGNLTNLHTLSLRGMSAADDDVPALAELEHLRNLDLSYTHIQEPGDWPRLPVRKLALEDTFIENDDLAAIARFRSLQELSLSFTEINDAGLPSLLPLAQLTTLRLAGTRITEPSYKVLCQFPNLKQVTLGSRPHHFVSTFSGGLPPAGAAVDSKT